MTPTHKFRQHFWKILLPATWVLLACGSFGPAPPSLSEVEILATADAIRSSTPVATPTSNTPSGKRGLDEIGNLLDEQETRKAEILAEDYLTAQSERATEAVVPSEQDHIATEEAAEATGTAEFFATLDASYETAEAEMADSGCSGGCITYPSWCEPPIKGNVSFNSGERIYHMPGDEFYEETVIDPRYGEYYFCTPEEAEAAGFRRAYE